MPQSYDVFMLNRRVHFRTKGALEAASDEARTNALWVVDPSSEMLRELPSLLKKSPDLQDVFVVSDALENVWMSFCSNYHELAAAGGVVKDNEGRVLWIERNGKWDLPKGKLEAGESLEAAAMREVEEETGITDLTITGEAFHTFHTYESEGKVHLKTTFWYPMRHRGSATPGVPQAVEGISAVTWLEPPFPASTLDRTFGSIRTVLDTLV